jgi:hypothetical protein
MSIFRIGMGAAPADETNPFEICFIYEGMRHKTALPPDLEPRLISDIKESDSRIKN